MRGFAKENSGWISVLGLVISACILTWLVAGQVRMGEKERIDASSEALSTRIEAVKSSIVSVDRNVGLLGTGISGVRSEISGLRKDVQSSNRTMQASIENLIKSQAAWQVKVAERLTRLEAGGIRVEVVDADGSIGRALQKALQAQTEPSATSGTAPSLDDKSLGVPASDKRPEQ